MMGVEEKQSPIVSVVVLLDVVDGCRCRWVCLLLSLLGIEGESAYEGSGWFVRVSL